ncbi:MAG: PAS domain S-box protein [Gammaproteobacteria bacterium]|nr:PAS domain S-box protein [Gammaproteobacteria bacterium]MBU1891780.1 PAS domain S-box protein [Gammaproteobacteria bacterium]
MLKTSASPSSQRPPRTALYIGAFVLLAAAILATGYFAYASVRDALREEKQADLAAIAILKTNQIAAWVAERGEDARLMAADRENATGFEHWLSQGAPENGDRQHLLAHLASTAKTSEYRNILLLDRDGNIRLHTGNNHPALDETHRQLALEVMKTGQIRMSELHRHLDEPGQPACLSFAAPLVVHGASPRTVGVLVLQLDPAHFLFPLVQSWPVPSQSAETLLIRLDGDQLTHLSKPRHARDESYFKSRTVRPDSPGYLAFRGKSGEAEGKDYRGIRVVASVRPVPGTPWHMISKVDSTEIYASTTRIAVIAITLTLAFLAAATGLGILWQRQGRMAYELIMARGERDREALTAHYASFIQHANDIVLLMRPDGSIVDANERAIQTYGYKREQLLALNIRDLRAPARRDEVDKQWLEVVAQDGLVFETEHQRQDGSMFPVEVSARFIDVKNQRFHQDFIRDISERREAQRQLEASRRLIEHARQEWEGVFDALSAPIFLHDEKFRILRANLAYARAAGKDIHEIIGQTYWEIFPRRDGPLASCMQALHNDQESQEEFDAGERTYVSRSFPVHESEQSGYSVHILEDITERKQSAQVLRESEERFRTIFDTANDGIVIIDSDGLIVNCNPEFEHQTGRTWEQLRQTHIWELRPDNKRDLAKKKFLETREAGTGGSSELEFQKPGGEIVPIEFRATAIKIGGKRFLQSITRDITERKHAETLLQRSMKAMATLSAGNTTLVHARDEQSLLDEFCRVIVEVGSYRIARVGYVQDDAEQTIRPMAQAGFEQKQLDDEMLTRVSSECALCPCSEAIHSGKTTIARDILNDPDMARRHAAATRFDYTACIALPLKDQGNAFGVLSIYANSVEAFPPEEIKLLEELAGDLAFGILTLRNDLKRQEAEVARTRTLEQLREAMEDTIGIIAATLEQRDPYTAGHQRRVAQLGVAIANELGLSKEETEGIHFGGLIHDLGKISVPAEILSKPGKLTQIEFELIKAHAQTGYEIVKEIDFPWPVADMVHQHHERLDGSGYPQGLKGEEITLGARILAVADVVEAMTSHRPYRPSLGIEPALEEITRNRGMFYDPDAVDACIKLFREGRFAFQVGM